MRYFLRMLASPYFTFFLAVVMAALGGVLAWLYLHRGLQQSQLHIALLRNERRRLAAKLGADKTRLSAGKRLVQRLGADNERLGQTIEVLEAERAALISLVANLEARVSNAVKASDVAAKVETDTANSSLGTESGAGRPRLPDGASMGAVMMDEDPGCDPAVATASRSLIAARDAEIRRLRAQLAPLLGLPLAIAAREAERDRLARRLALREDELRNFSRLDRPETEGEHSLQLVPPSDKEKDLRRNGDTGPKDNVSCKPPRHDHKPAVRHVASVQAEALPRPGPTAEIDNLKRIRGIGPVLERMLNRLGVYQYRQIAAWTDEDVAWFDSALEEFRGRIERDGWVASAGIEHERKYGEPRALP